MLWKHIEYGFHFRVHLFFYLYLQHTVRFHPWIRSRSVSIFHNRLHACRRPHMYHTLRSTLYLSRHSSSLTSVLSLHQHDCLLYTSCSSPRWPSLCPLDIKVKLFIKRCIHTLHISKPRETCESMIQLVEFHWVHFWFANRRRKSHDLLSRLAPVRIKSLQLFAFSALCPNWRRHNYNCAILWMLSIRLWKHFILCHLLDGTTHNQSPCQQHDSLSLQHLSNPTDSRKMRSPKFMTPYVERLFKPLEMTNLAAPPQVSSYSFLNRLSHFTRWRSCMNRFQRLATYGVRL